MTKSPGRETAKALDEAADTRLDVRLGKLDSYIGFHLRMAQTASFRGFRERSDAPDLRPGWFAVLSIIDDNPGISPAALSRAAGRDKSTLTPVISALAREGYVERRPRPNDRRSYRLYLRPAGRDYKDAIAVHAVEHERMLDEIAGDRKDELIRLLRRIGEELG